MYPTSLVALERFQVVQYDKYKRVKNTSFRCDGRCSGLYKLYFSYVVAEMKRLFPEIFP